MSKLICGALVLLMFSQCSSPSTESNNTSTKLAFADKIELTDLEGERVSLTDFRGKTIILNVWATWCGPCIKEMPSLESMQKQLSSDDFVLLLASAESMDKIEGFKARFPFDFNYVQLNTAQESLGIYALPTTFIINDKGELIITENGMKDWNTPESIEQVSNLPVL